MTSKPHAHRRFDSASAWVVAHAGRIWAFAIVAIVLALSWQTLHGIHMRDFRRILHALDGRWLVTYSLVEIPTAFEATDIDVH